MIKTIRLLQLNGEEHLFPDWTFRTEEPPQVIVYQDKAYFCVYRGRCKEAIYQEYTTLTIVDSTGQEEHPYGSGEHDVVLDAIKEHIEGA